MPLQLGVSRQREFLADATGAQLPGSPAPLADALRAWSPPDELRAARPNWSRGSGTVQRLE